MKSLKKINKNKHSVHFSSASNEWETPDVLYRTLDDHYGFNLDPCATIGNAKCSKYFTKEDNGLEQDWGGHTVFMNPPYGKKEQSKWIIKAYNESLKDGTTVVCLIPARTDTKVWHEYCMKAKNIVFFKGRIKFVQPGQAKRTPAPFPSCLVIFDYEFNQKGLDNGPVFTTMKA
jgi:site-specific DNA-methyltransferase (adenine-specific)